jgi:hypothetical protein
MNCALFMGVIFLGGVIYRCHVLTLIHKYFFPEYKPLRYFYALIIIIIIIFVVAIIIIITIIYSFLMNASPSNPVRLACTLCDMSWTNSFHLKMSVLQLL